VLELRDGTRMNSHVGVQNDINLHNQKEAHWCKLNGSGASDLIRMISSTSFTQLTTFGKRHHSPPYNILCASSQKLHPNVTFP